MDSTNSSLSIKRCVVSGHKAASVLSVKAPVVNRETGKCWYRDEADLFQLYGPDCACGLGPDPLSLHKKYNVIKQYVI